MQTSKDTLVALKGISGFSFLRFGSRVRACILAISNRIPMQIIVLMTRSIQKDADTALLDPQLILTVLDESAIPKVLAHAFTSKLNLHFSAPADVTKQPETY